MLSLIVPSHRNDSLKRKLESLKEQSLPASEFEVLVVILESEAEGLEALRSSWPFQLRTVLIPDDTATNKHIVSLKRNWGTKGASSNLYMFTDDDVFHTKDCLKTFADFFKTGFRGIATCDLRFESGAIFRLGSETETINNVRWMQLSSSLAVMDKGTFEKVGTFKENFRERGEDVDYGYRAKQAGVAMKRLAGDWAVHEGAPRNDFATGKSSGYGAYLSAQAHDQAYALALGVHPFSLLLKSLAFRARLSRLFTTTYYKEYERGYLAGALEARREAGGRR
jgi:predicted glycosyltransferase involved in capsule biosynthesis